MRKIAFIRAALILFGLVPIGIWALWAARLVDAAQEGGREVGLAVVFLFFTVLLLTPALIGGIMMVWGGAWFVRKPDPAPIVAVIGTAIVLVSSISLFFLFGFVGPRVIIFAAIAYLLVHCGLLVWVWRNRSTSAEPARGADVQSSSG